MRNRLTGTVLAVAMAAAVTVIPNALQAKDMKQPATLAGHPNLNGIWQVMSGADWNLEAHSATELKDFWKLGAFGAIPAGMSVVEGGTIPYKEGKTKQRDENWAGWPKSDPEANCYLPGIPRATYIPHPFQIIQGTGDILMVYAYASANRIINIKQHIEPQIDTWMGVSNGEWDGDTLVVTSTGFNDKTWLDRAGNYHSPNMKVTERFKPVELDSYRVHGDDRRSGYLHQALDDQAVSLQARGAGSRASGFQVRAVHREADLWRLVRLRLQQGRQGGRRALFEGKIAVLREIR